MSPNSSRKFKQKFNLPGRGQPQTASRPPRDRGCTEHESDAAENWNEINASALELFPATHWEMSTTCANMHKSNPLSLGNLTPGAHGGRPLPTRRLWLLDVCNVMERMSVQR